MFNLRYYQLEAKAAAFAEWQRHRSTAVVLPTACGKTELYLSIAAEAPGRTLVLVHRDHLITSPVRRLAAAGFRDVAVEKGDSYASDAGRAKIVFASVQSIGPKRQAHRLAAFAPKDFDHLVIDEGHRAVSPIYRRVKDYFEAGNPGLKTLILTATPRRKDGVGLWNVCESTAYEMSPGRAAEEGWIVPPRFFVRDVPELDYSKVDLRGTDLDADQLAEIMLEEEPLQKVCASLAEDQGPTIVFCPKVDVALAYAAVLSRRYRHDKAVAIHQHSTSEEREAAEKGLLDGSIDFVLNVDVFTEGYDVPRIVRVVWAAPTASLVRWTQGCGRGFRPDAAVAKRLEGGREDAARRRLMIAQSSKPICEIFTYHASNMRHKICDGIDLLAGSELPPAVKDAAAQVQAATSRNAGSDVAEDLETAQVYLDFRAVLDAEREAVKAKATVMDAEYDGMGGAAPALVDRPGLDASASSGVIDASWLPGEPASSKQIKWLLWKGLDRSQAERMTKWRASVVRDLFEAGVSLSTAVRYPKRQALKVRDEIRSRQEAAS